MCVLLQRIGLLYLLLLLSTALRSLSAAAAPVLAGGDDRAALMALYTAAGGPGWVDSSLWGAGSTPGVCQWFGVSCGSDGRVTSLVLVSNNLVGTIPPAIGGLVALSELNLFGNHLSGGIPVSVCDLGNLTTLILAGNLITGVIPASLGSLVALQQLDLSMNSIQGEIPASLTSLSELQYCLLYDNALSGNIPFGLGPMMSGGLRILSLANNSLSGDIPTDLCPSGESFMSLADNCLNAPSPALRECCSGDASSSGVGNCELGGQNRQSCTELDPADRAALMDLYQSCGGPAWPKRDGWGTSANGCTWYGVTCDADSRVEKLGLSNNTVRCGTLPTGPIVALTGLTHLDLSGNLINGTVSIPVAIMSNLNYLSVANNQLSGAVLEITCGRPPCDWHFEGNCLAPLSWCVLPNCHSGGSTGCTPVENELQALRSIFNEMGGVSWKFPPPAPGQPPVLWLSDFAACSWSGVTCCRTSSGEARVMDLYLQGIDMSGTISSSIAALSNLTVLQIGGNRLVGTLPPALCSLSLTALNFSSNELSGTLPKCLANLSYLGSLSANENLFVGPFDNALLAIAKLQTLKIGDNCLDPDSLTALTAWCNKHTCDASDSFNSQASGCLPPVEERNSLMDLYKAAGMSQNAAFLGWTTSSRVCDKWTGVTCTEPGPGRTTFVATLSLGSKDLSGTLPNSIANLTHLTNLSIELNAVTGTIPPGLRALSALRYLSFSDNSLNGTVPDVFAMMPSLVYLKLAGNFFFGTMPKSICSLGILEHLDFSNNNFSGPLPSCMNSMIMLQDLFLSANSFSGGIPELGTHNLIKIRLNNNAFSGPLPRSFSQTFFLKELNLANNKLNGSIAREILELPSLRTVLLSNNNFAGTIPLASLKFGMSTLELSNNDFEAVDVAAENTEIVSLSLSGNRLGIVSPGAFWGFKNLQVLELSGNGISNIDGILNATAQPCLRHLDFSFNELTGTVPAFVCSWVETFSDPRRKSCPSGSPALAGPGLFGLLLSSNKLSGTLPDCFVGTHWSVLDFSVNFFNGRVPPSMLTLPYARTLDLSFNNLEGNFPSALLNISGAQRLDFSRNFFRGVVNLNAHDVVGSVSVQGNCALQCDGKQPTQTCAAAPANFVWTPQQPMISCRKVSPGVPTSVILLPRPDSAQEGSISVSWVPPALAHTPYGGPLFYKVSCINAAENSTVVTLPQTSNTSAVVQGLEFDVVYILCVTAVNDVGPGICSEHYAVVPRPLFEWSWDTGSAVVAAQIFMAGLLWALGRWVRKRNPGGKVRRNMLGLFTLQFALVQVATDLLYGWNLLQLQKSGSIAAGNPYTATIAYFCAQGAAVAWSSFHVVSFVVKALRTEPEEPHTLNFLDWLWRFRTWSCFALALSCLELQALTVLTCAAFGGVDGPLSAPATTRAWKFIRFHATFVSIVRASAVIACVWTIGTLRGMFQFLKLAAACGQVGIFVVKLCVDALQCCATGSAAAAARKGRGVAGVALSGDAPGVDTLPLVKFSNELHM